MQKRVFATEQDFVDFIKNDKEKRKIYMKSYMKQYRVKNLEKVRLYNKTYMQNYRKLQKEYSKCEMTKETER